MKLYTEEQVREAYNRGRTDWINEIEDYYIFSELIPIELPSDEEIEEQSFDKSKTEDASIRFMCEYYFIKGAKWMKEQILKNK